MREKHWEQKAGNRAERRKKSQGRALEKRHAGLENALSHISLKSHNENKDTCVSLKHEINRQLSL